MDRCSIAMINMTIILKVERDVTPVVEHHRHAHPIDVLDRTERAVFHAHLAFVSKEHDAVSFREATVAALDLGVDFDATRASRLQPFADVIVERSHFVIGVGKNDPATVGTLLTIALQLNNKFSSSRTP